jgi:CRP/FNR family transcriptional regulator, cyclic AMP receptor protein
LWLRLSVVALRWDGPSDYHLWTVDELLDRAVHKSFLGTLPVDVVDRLVQGAYRIELPAGGLKSGVNRAPIVILVAAGLLRFVRVAADGRTVAQRHLRCGDVAGIGTVFDSLDAAKPTARGEALTQTVCYGLSPERWRHEAEHNPSVAVAMLKDLSRVAEIAIDEMAERVLASLRQRVVRQLLEAAEPNGGPELIATITQQQLADGVGSAREVVARILHELRNEKLVETRVGSVVLCDPERLAAELRAP